MKTPDGLSKRLIFRTSRMALKHPVLCLIIWFAIFALALPSSLKVVDVLEGGNGGIDGAESLISGEYISKSFDFPFTISYQVVLHSDTHTLDDAFFKTAVAELKAALIQEPDTLAVQSYYDQQNHLMLSKDKKSTFLMVGQERAPPEELEKRVPQIRGHIQPVIEKLQTKDPSFKVMTTGMIPTVADVNVFSAQSTAKAEKQVFVFTLLILLMAFGSLTSAVLPIVIAIFANVICMALVYHLTAFFQVSIFAQSISTMIGLAAGIDYALLFVWRYRDELKIDQQVMPALERTAIHSGHSIFFAGFTFMIGLSGLFFAGMTTLYSIALAGVIVVCLSVFLSITLLPALLLLFHRYMEFPKFLYDKLKVLKPNQFWYHLCLRVMRHPWRWGLGSLFIIFLLTAPVYTLRIGQLDLRQLPPHLESQKGANYLGNMQVSGIMTPMIVIATAPDNILQEKYLKGVSDLADRLRQHALIEEVHGIVPQQQQGRQAFYAQLPMIQILYPTLINQFISQDRTTALLQVIPKSLQDFEALVDLTQEMREVWAPEYAQKYQLTLASTGSPSITLDYNIATFKYIYYIVFGVIIVSYLVLLWSLHSYLIAFKAIVLNLCSVAVSYGVITMVFQWGILEPWVHTASIMAYVPLLLFCMIFGMSIDYEVFLMTRIKEEYDKGASNEEATALGIRATGDVISYAAMIMCLVFGAFMLVEVSIIRQLGFGLAAAILIDASLIRMILVPALMKLAGKWNWYPG